MTPPLMYSLFVNKGLLHTNIEFREKKAKKTSEFK